MRGGKGDVRKGERLKSTEADASQPVNSSGQPQADRELWPPQGWDEAGLSGGWSETKVHKQMKKMGKEWHSEVDDGDGAVGGGPTRQSLRASLRTEGSTHAIHWASLFPGINILLIIRSITERLLLFHLDRMFEFYYAYVDLLDRQDPTTQKRARELP
ncbi:hypothetical protein BDV11DRAFT_65106 [Aspergillus similis]